MTPARWSRSGCLTCKKRRKRCDESKPSCRNCARLGMACEGYGSIWTEPLNPSTQVFQSRQKRRNISPSQCPQPGEELESRVFPCSSHTGSLSSYSPGSSDTTRSIRDGAEDESTGAVVAIPRSCGYSHLSTLELHYLQYHVEQGSKLLANLETDENPLRALIIPRALLSPLLMKAVCAVSAMHLANRSHDSLNNGTTATNYYIRTLRGLRSTLSEPPSSALRDDTMLAVAFLCKYEIVRGSVKQWAIHLDALQKLVISRGGFSRLDQETAEFLWGLFMYANNVAKITNRREFKAITPAPHNVGITKLDIYIGYTEELIKICARIADLPFQAVDSLMIALEISDIDESLQSWSVSTRQYIVPKGITQDTLSRLQMVADCFHEAAYIYLHSTLERMAQNIDTYRIPPAWRSFISVSESDARNRCLARIDSSCLDGHCEYSALTFPLFIAGCESGSHAERDIVARSLGALETSFGFGNVGRVRELLGMLWDGDTTVHWQDMLEELRWDLILA